MEPFSVFPSEPASALLPSLEDRGLVLLRDRALIADADAARRRAAVRLRGRSAIPELNAKTMFPTRLLVAPDLIRSVETFSLSLGATCPSSIPRPLWTEVRRLGERFGEIVDGFLHAAGIRYGWSPETVQGLLCRDEWVLNFLEYPRRPDAADDLCFPPHRDWGLCTLTVGDDGLEVLVDRSWIPISASEDTFPMYGGATLERFTGRRLRSVSHRVVRPPRGALIFYADAPRWLRFPGAEETVGDFIDGRLRRIGHL